jgi:hypothetical protein
MSPNLTKQVGEPKDFHKLSKKVSDSDDLKATSESINIFQTPAAPKSPAKLRRGRDICVDDHFETMQSTPEISYNEQRLHKIPARPAPAKLSRSNAMNFDRTTIAAQIASLAPDDKSLPTKNSINSSETLINQSEVSRVVLRDRSNSVESNQSRESSSILQANNQYHSNFQTNDESQQRDTPTDLTLSMRQSFPYRPAKQMRYYSWALSEEDKQALATGETSRNVKDWNANDLVRFYESQLELVPRGLDDRDAVIEKIQKDKEHAEEYLLRGDKQVFPFQRSMLHRAHQFRFTHLRGAALIDY